jgi:tRNA pseudouridine32 synthase/23S rRNA pseudouridine746 synthase
MLTRTMHNPARTRFISTSLSPGLRLYALRLETGRTHQIRVAMKSAGAPVLGDDRYHPRPPDEMLPDRGYLHALSLAFTLNGQRYLFRSLPEHGTLFHGEDFSCALRALLDRIPELGPLP